MPTDYGSYSVDALEEIRSDIVEFLDAHSDDESAQWHYADGRRIENFRATCPACKAREEVARITAILGDREARATDDGRDT